MYLKFDQAITIADTLGRPTTLVLTHETSYAAYQWQPIAMMTTSRWKPVTIVPWW